MKVDGEVVAPEKHAALQKGESGVSSAVGRTLVVAENYPDLKANKNFIELQSKLEGNEKRITVARKDFNDTAKSYNRAMRKFPKNLLAGLFGFEKKSYFEDEAGSEKAPKVEF